MTTSQIVLTVTQLTQAIKFQLEKQFPKIVVQGEVSNFKSQSSGHLYFTLKDRNAQIQCVMFSSDARQLKKPLKSGDQVELRGEINVYPPRGNYQIIVRSLRPAGLGELLLLLEERKNKYLQMGWLDSHLKKPLPKSPKTIGVVTSPTGAVIRDILQVLSRRSSGFYVLINPVRVQGAGAKEEISRAIDDFNHYNLVDLIIVARGGGSMEDLWAFNEECVVESIHNSRLPVLAAIGHETDTTLADLVADVRAPTPSSAAELALEEEEKRRSFLKMSVRHLDHMQLQLIKRCQEKVQGILNHPFLLSPLKLLQMYQQQLDQQVGQLDQVFLKVKHFFQTELHEKKCILQTLSPKLMIHNSQNRLKLLRQNFQSIFCADLQNKKSKLNAITTHFRAIHPKKLLEKGYSILFDEKSQSVIVSTQDISLNQNVKLLLKDGTIKAHVNEIEPGEPCKT